MVRSRLFGGGRLFRSVKNMFHRQPKGEYHEIDGNIYEYDNRQGVLRGVSKKVKGKVIQLKQTVKN